MVTENCPTEFGDGATSDGARELPSLTQLLAQTTSAEPPEVEFAAWNRRDRFRNRRLVFELDAAWYAMPLSNVVELQHVPDISAIPRTPYWLAGVTNLRGTVVSVVDLRLFLGLPPADFGWSRRLVVIRATEGEMRTALVVDRVVGIRQLNSSDPAQRGAFSCETGSEYLETIAGLGNQMVGLLDVEKLLASDQFRKLH